MSVLLIIAASTILRLVLAVVLGLGVDESYEVAVARHLSWSYFDHPPLTFWILHFFTGIFGEGRLAVRLPFILLFAGTTWLLYRLAARLFGERAGVIAVLLISSSPVFSLSTGGWALPDGPLMFFTVLAAYALARATIVPDDRPGRWWLVVGAATGGAMLSKYHGLLLGAAIVAFVVTQPDARRWLGRRAPYAAALIALAMLTPVVAWNAAHGWISLRFQAGRGAPHHGVHLDALAQSLGGQIGYVLPWIWIPLAWVFVQALRAGPRDPRRWLLACLAFLPVVLFTLVSLGGNPGLPHWEAPGYLVLFPLLGAAAAVRLARGEQATRWWLRGSVAAFLVLVAVAGAQTATGLMRIAGDPTVEMVDWTELKDAARQLGVRDGGRFVVAGNWIQAGKAAYAIGPEADVVCLCGEPHHFAFTANRAALAGHDALIVEAGRRSAPSRFAPFFETITPRGEVTIRRAGRPALVLELSVGRGFFGR